MTDPVAALTRLGGVARWAELRRAVSRRAFRRAVADGRIVRRLAAGMPCHWPTPPGSPARD